MSDATQHSVPINDAKRERFRFSLAQLFSVVLIICLVLGTIRLLFTSLDRPLFTFLIAAIGFGTSWLIWLRLVKGRARLAEVGVTAAIIGLLSACLFPAVRAAKERSHKPHCLTNLRQIVLALHMYHDEYGSLPPAYVADADGKPMHSWRVLILPFLEYDPLYRKYRLDEPWDGPNNRQLHNQIVAVFSCPGALGGPSRTPSTETSYVVVVGPQTAFPGEKTVSFDAIRDGRTSTLLVVEVANSGIHWMEPRDLHVTQMSPQINPRSGQGISSHHRGGANAAFADGAVKFLSEDLSATDAQALLTIDAGDPPAAEGR